MPVLRCFGGVAGACVGGSFSRLKRQMPFTLGEPKFLYLITNIIELEGKLMDESKIIQLHMPDVGVIVRG